MQMMLHICDKVAETFDIKFNSSKSVSMHTGSRYGERCSALQLVGKDILYVELKYLGVPVTAAKFLKIPVDLRRQILK